MASRAYVWAERATQECIKECAGCHAICLAALAQFIETKTRTYDDEHMRLLLDCAEICQTTANFMLRGSGLHAALCAACAEVCERCAESCNIHGQQVCADACRRCADACRRLSG
jgi:hypothetical protein